MQNAIPFFVVLGSLGTGVYSVSPSVINLLLMVLCVPSRSFSFHVIDDGFSCSYRFAFHVLFQNGVVDTKRLSTLACP